MPDPRCELVAALVSMGARLEALEARLGVMADPLFSEWSAEQGGAGLLARRLGRPLGLMQLHLLRLAARERPEWLDPVAVDLADPLALQLLDQVDAITGG